MLQVVFENLRKIQDYIPWGSLVFFYFFEVYTLVITYAGRARACVRVCVRIRVHVCARVYYIYILYLLYKIYIILILDLKDLEYIILRILKTRTRQARASCERVHVGVYAGACAQARTRDNS